METDVLGCTINQPLARFVCCWVFCFFFFLFFTNYQKFLCFQERLTFSCTQQVKSSLWFYFAFVTEGDGPTQWEVLMSLTLEKFLKIWLGVG